MAYNNSQNNGKDYSNDVNTRGIQLSNKDGFDPSTMNLGYWNGFLSIKINPALDKSKQTDTRVYDYEKTVSTALSPEKISLILEKIKQDIIPAMEAGEDKSIGVPTGTNSLVVVGTGKRQTGEIRPFFAIHRALNDTTKRPEMSIAYEFNRIQSIDDYNDSTGSYNVDNSIHAEFKLFIRVLEAALVGLSNATVHANRVVNRSLNDKIVRLLEAICNKLGIDTQTTKSYKPANVFNSTNTYTKEPVQDEDVNTLENIEDLNKYMS